MTNSIDPIIICKSYLYFIQYDDKVYYWWELLVSLITKAVLSSYCLISVAMLNAVSFGCNKNFSLLSLFILKDSHPESFHVYLICQLLQEVASAKRASSEKLNSQILETVDASCTEDCEDTREGADKIISLSIRIFEVNTQ